MTTTTTTRATSTAAAVRAIHDEINPPEGYRVEIIAGNIPVAPPPFGMHAFILNVIRETVAPTLSPAYRLFENTTLEEPEVDRYIPDLAAWPLDLVKTDDQWIFPGNRCLLAVEVTSPRQEARDYAKAAGYARSGVPVYLLVDRAQRKCVVFIEPKGDSYRDRHEIPFGKPATLPLEAGPVTVDTAEF